MLPPFLLVLQYLFALHTCVSCSVIRMWSFHLRLVSEFLLFTSEMWNSSLAFSVCCFVISSLLYHASGTSSCEHKFSIVFFQHPHFTSTQSGWNTQRFIKCYPRVLWRFLNYRFLHSSPHGVKHLFYLWRKTFTTSNVNKISSGCQLCQVIRIYHLTNWHGWYPEEILLTLFFFC